ncbi:MAG: 2'-5' RNA ligase family protein [Lachnospiraceae bacterium]
MALRTVMIFPKFDNIELIDDIRKQYDPLAEVISPHITIVFPFDMDVSNEELSEILDKRLADVKPFPIEIFGISKHEDRFGNYLFLNLTKGADDVIKLHDLLYKNEFAKLDLGLEYVPHITVGKLENENKLNEAYEKIKEFNGKFSCVIDKISVEMIGPNEESIIIMEKRLS